MKTLSKILQILKSVGTEVEFQNENLVLHGCAFTYSNGSLKSNISLGNYNLKGIEDITCTNADHSRNLNIDSAFNIFMELADNISCKNVTISATFCPGVNNLSVRHTDICNKTVTVFQSNFK